MEQAEYDCYRTKRILENLDTKYGIGITKDDSKFVMEFDYENTHYKYEFMCGLGKYYADDQEVENASVFYHLIMRSDLESSENKITDIKILKSEAGCFAFEYKNSGALFSEWYVTANWCRKTLIIVDMPKVQL